MNLSLVQNLVKDKKFLVLCIVSLVTALAVLVSFLAFNQEEATYDEEGNVTVPKPVTISRVEPLPDAQGISTTPTLKIYFQKSVVEQKLEIFSDPQMSFESKLAGNGRELVLTPQSSLVSNTEYTLSLSVNTQLIYEWSFTTRAQGAPIDVVNKIKSQLPYKAQGWAISYLPSNDRFYLNVDKNNEEKSKQASLTWLRSQGLNDPENQLNLIVFPVDTFSD